MITKEMLDRINYLSRKSRGEGLTEEEKLEQQKLRGQYLEYIKGQVRQQLESIEFVEDGNKCNHEHHDGHHNCNCKKH
ncbi:MAG: DUF896 domain-containing protein [Caulobacteraceae bacterium]